MNAIVFFSHEFFWSPNTKGVDGWTALVIAATSGVIEIVQILLADKRTQFLSGSTRGSPLHLAA